MKINILIIVCIFLTGCTHSQQKSLPSTTDEGPNAYSYILEKSNTDSTKFGYQQIDAYFYGIAGIAFLGDQIVITDSYHNNAKVFVDSGNLLKLVNIIDFGEASDFMVGDCYAKDDYVYFLDNFRNQFRRYDINLKEFTTISFHPKIKESTLQFVIWNDSLVITCNDNDIIPSCKYYDMNIGQILPTTEEKIDNSIGLKDDIFYNDFKYRKENFLYREIEHRNLFYRSIDLKRVNNKFQYILVVENNEEVYYFYRVNWW